MLLVTIVFLLVSTSNAFGRASNSQINAFRSLRPPSFAISSVSSVSSYETFGDGALSDTSFAELYGNNTASSALSGNDLSNPEEAGSSSRDDMWLPEWLTSRCDECGWTYPTLIQERALDVILGGKDCVVQAQTGSGKTLCYLLPLLARVDPSRAAIQALVVVPTRELGLQVARVAKRLCAGSAQDERKKIMVMTVLQGSANRRQRAWAWAEPPHVVIGTPEELTNMVKYGGIRYNAVRYVVVDEVDACLLNNGGSYSVNTMSSSPLHELLSRYLSPSFDNAEATMGGLVRNLNEASLLTTSASNLEAASRPTTHGTDRQTVFASATIPQHRHFIQQCVQNQWTVREPEHVCASPGELVPPTLQHVSIVCSGQERKFGGLRRFLKKQVQQKKLTRAIIFCEEHRPMDEMAAAIAKDLNGIVWKDGYGPEMEKGISAVATVLRYQDNLSKRASAMLGFQGLDGGNIGGRFEKDEETLSTDEDENDLDDAGVVKKDDGIVRIMLSTDLAARGLDVDDISHVINFDLPNDGDTYVHRGGRAGRLGRKGMVVNLIISNQEFVLQRLANKLSLDVRCIARQEAKKMRKKID
eukprot:scaffold92866_cov49-Attheya_sp.AAC.2